MDPGNAKTYSNFYNGLFMFDIRALRLTLLVRDHAINESLLTMEFANTNIYLFVHAELYEELYPYNVSIHTYCFYLMKHIVVYTEVNHVIL